MPISPTYNIPRCGIFKVSCLFRHISIGYHWLSQRHYVVLFRDVNEASERKGQHEPPASYPLYGYGLRTYQDIIFVGCDDASSGFTLPLRCTDALVDGVLTEEGLLP